MNPVDIGRAEAQRRAAEELAKPGYQHESLPGGIIRAILDFLGDLLHVDTGRLAGRLALAALIVIIAAFVALLLWQVWRARRSASLTDPAVFGERRLSAAEHRAEAERLAGAGRWAEAIRERLRAIARDLEDRAVVDPLPGRTAHELAEAAGRELPGLAAHLTAAAALFDDVTYGEADGTPGGYATLASLDERLSGTAVAR